MSFASRFKAGSDIAKDLISTYDSAKEQAEIDKINQSKQIESEGFTPEDDAQRLAMQNAKKPDGTPYYDITAGDEKGGYGVKLNFTTKDASGADVVPADIKRDPVKMYDFMGKRSDKPLTEAEQTRGKERASIDVLARRDPKLGLQMRAAANAEDRAEKTFALTEKASGLQLAGLERTEKTAKAGEFAEQAVQDHYAKRPVNPATGEQDPLTHGDVVTGLQIKAFHLLQNGQTTAGEQAWEKSTDAMVKNVTRQEVERTQALAPALLALQGGNTKPMMDAYNKYIPDGYAISSIEAGKDGNFTINRTGIDGKSVAPMSVSLADIAGQFEALKDPKYIITAAQTAFANQLAARKIANDERKNDISERKLDAAIGLGRLGGGGGGGGKGGGDATEKPSPFNSLADFDPKQARKQAMDLAEKESESEQKPYSEKRAQQIYGNLRDAAARDNVKMQRASVFQEIARQAKTPAEIAQVALRAGQSGFTRGEMAEYDPRFAEPKPAPADKNVNAKGVPRAAEGATRNAPTSDPMKAKLDLENREVNAMTRNKFSPDVQAYLDQIAATKASKFQKDNADFLERERRINAEKVKAIAARQ